MKPIGATPPESDRWPIALCCSRAEEPAWIAALGAELPQARPSVWPNVAEDAECAIVWSASQSFIDAHPALRLIFNMGAGVDALLRLRLPPEARILRLEDSGMAVQMADYVCHAVLRHVREFDLYDRSTRAGAWEPREPRDRRDFPVGVMGLGALGQCVATTLTAFEFPVLGWSRSAKAIGGVTCFAGDADFDRFLAGTRILVCLLPLTPATRGILCHASLARLQPRGYLVNVARGGHLVEADLLRLLDSGHLAGATLDVTREEPLPFDHAFWSRPEIVLTPHIAAQTVVREAIAQIAAKCRADRAGTAVTGAVDPARGY